MNKINKIFRILLIILFPLGIVYCIGKNLFSGNFASFLGGLFLALIGFGLAIYFFRPDLIEKLMAIFSAITGG